MTDGKTYDLVVVGTGTAAQVASFRVRAAGWSVAASACAHGREAKRWRSKPISWCMPLGVCPISMHSICLPLGLLSKTGISSSTNFCRAPQIRLSMRLVMLLPKGDH